MWIKLIILPPIGLFPEKIHTPTTEGMLENLTGEGVNGSGNSDLMNLKINPRGFSISSMFQSLHSIFFQKIALPFQILLFFQSTDLLPHLF